MAFFQLRGSLGARLLLSCSAAAGLACSAPDAAVTIPAGKARFSLDASLLGGGASSGVIEDGGLGPSDQGPSEPDAASGGPCATDMFCGTAYRGGVPAFDSKNATHHPADFTTRDCTSGAGCHGDPAIPSRLHWTIAGTVFDNAGKGMGNVEVWVKGISKPIITDSQGAFASTTPLPPGAVGAIRFMAASRLMSEQASAPGSFDKPCSNCHAAGGSAMVPIAFP